MLKKLAILEISNLGKKMKYELSADKFANKARLLKGNSEMSPNITWSAYKIT